jgi:hypothetical protein
MSEIACKNCLFFRGDAAIMGSCRRYPQTMNKFPVDWCGEFQLVKSLSVTEQRDEIKPGRKKSDPTFA